MAADPSMDEEESQSRSSRSEAHIAVEGGDSNHLDPENNSVVACFLDTRTDEVEYARTARIPSECAARDALAVYLQ